MPANSDVGPLKLCIWEAFTKVYLGYMDLVIGTVVCVIICQKTVQYYTINRRHSWNSNSGFTPMSICLQTHILFLMLLCPPCNAIRITVESHFPWGQVLKSGIIKDKLEKYLNIPQSIIIQSFGHAIQYYAYINIYHACVCKMWFYSIFIFKYVKETELA